MCADIAATQTSNSDEWETPWWLVNLLAEEFCVHGHFDLDPAATAKNAKGVSSFGKELNGLRQEWWGNVFVNPPYSQIEQWTKKCYQEAYNGNATVVLLAAARPDTRYWWDFSRHGEVRFIKGRLKFIDPSKDKQTGAPFPSAVVIFRKNFQRLTPTTAYWDIPKDLRTENKD
jgi:phage N-6-adenine-methyltransferase